ADRERQGYLDNAATTPLDPRVRERMLDWLGTETGYANPASTHAPGRQAAMAVERARAEVAALIGAAEDEIVWTSGATEANNLAIFGAARAHGERRGRRIITLRSEHKSVLEPCRQLAREGYDLVELPVAADGSLDLAQRSEEHTSELQSRENLVCRLLLEKKKESHENGRRMYIQ